MSALVDLIVGQARNNAWANHRLLGACKALTPEEFAAARTGFFPSLRATLNHIFLIDTYYIRALEHDPAALELYSTPAPDFPDVGQLAEAQRAGDRRLISFCERQTEASLAEGLVLPRPNRTPPPTSVASILEHLFQHQTHHRGQAHAMLSSTSVKPPQLDEFFLAGEEHLPRVVAKRGELRALGLPET